MSPLVTCSQPARLQAGGEPLDRLGVGPDCLGGLALSGQAQGERIDLGLEDPGVQLLGLPETRSWCGHGHSSPLRRTIRTQRYRMQQTAKPQQDRRDDPRDYV